MAAIDQPAEIMIAEVFADAGQVGDDRYAERAQALGRTDAGQLQELRRIERARRDDDLAAGESLLRLAAAQIVDAAGALAVEQNAGGERLRHDAQVGASARRFEIGGRGRRAHAAAHRRLVIAGAFLRRAVEIVVAAMTGFDGGVDEGLGERMLVAHVRDAERSVAAVEFVGAAFVALGLAEVGQHILEAPAGIAELTPVVEVAGLAADINQPVDRA